MSPSGKMSTTFCVENVDVVGIVGYLGTSRVFVLSRCLKVPSVEVASFCGGLSTRVFFHHNPGLWVSHRRETKPSPLWRGRYAYAKNPERRLTDIHSNCKAKFENKNEMSPLWLLMGDFSKGGVHKTDGLWWVMFSKGGVHKTDGFWWVIFQRGEYTKPMGFDGW